MRVVVAAIVVCLAGLTGSARAASLLFFDSQPGDYIGGGVPRRFTELDGTFSASSNFGNGVSITLAGGRLGFWSLDFAAPMGSELAAGTYDGATRFPFQSPTEPGLSVDGDGRGCNTLTGRFVVLDVTYGPTGDVVSFAADFEQHCAGGPAALFGSIRFRAGDAACQQAADGSPCDDGDACTAASRCQAGVCEGDGLSACTTAGSCQVASCDPIGGACVTRAARDGALCNDGDACTIAESCVGGVCTGGFQGMVCDDGNACTADLCHDSTCDFSQPTICPDGGGPCTEPFCDPTLGCTSRPVAGCCIDDADCNDDDPCTADVCDGGNRCLNEPLACWSIVGKAKATVFAQGKTAHVTRRLAGILTFTDDGRYRIPGGICPQTGEPFPDEVGITRPSSRGRLLLESANRLELDAALDACVGRHVRVLGSRTWVKILTDQQHLRGGSGLHARTRVRGVTVTIAVMERFAGSRVVEGFGIVSGGLSRSAIAEHLSLPGR
jgi:hypothetical protein